MSLQGQQCDIIEGELNLPQGRMEQLQDTETVEECINLVKKVRPAATGMKYKDKQSTTE